MTRLTVDELEILTPDQLGWILLNEVNRDSPDVRYIQDLLDVGCLIDFRNERNWNALFCAAYWGHLEVANILISNGADVDARDDWGQTALILAAINGNAFVVKFLLSKGADVNARTNSGVIAWNVATSMVKRVCPELKP